jgi:hypothetical protein
VLRGKLDALSGGADVDQLLDTRSRLAALSSVSLLLRWCIMKPHLARLILRLMRLLM